MRAIKAYYLKFLVSAKRTRDSENKWTGVERARLSAWQASVVSRRRETPWKGEAPRGARCLPQTPCPCPALISWAKAKAKVKAKVKAMVEVKAKVLALALVGETRSCEGMLIPASMWLH